MAGTLRSAHPTASGAAGCTRSFVIAREGGRSSIPETLVIEATGRGELDAPPSRSM